MQDYTAVLMQNMSGTAKFYDLVERRLVNYVRGRRHLDKPTRLTV